MNVTGLRAKRVSALMHNHGLPVDLVDACMVEFEGGALGTVGGSSNARPSMTANKRETSSRAKTVGTRWARLARVTPSSHGRSMRRTSR